MGPDFIASIAAAAALALGTLVSEDLTCITAGVMIATGRLGPIAAVSGCFLGIMAGDLLLFLAGRLYRGVNGSCRISARGREGAVGAVLLGLPAARPRQQLPGQTQML